MVTYLLLGFGVVDAPWLVPYLWLSPLVIPLSVILAMVAAYEFIDECIEVEPNRTHATVCGVITGLLTLEVLFGLYVFAVLALMIYVIYNRHYKILGYWVKPLG